jgi:hypothetical protein
MYTKEDPFQGTLRLSILCESIRRDVLGDEAIRQSAFKLDDSEEAADDDEDGDVEQEQQDTTAFEDVARLRNNGRKVIEIKRKRSS